MKETPLRQAALMGIFITMVGCGGRTHSPEALSSPAERPKAACATDPKMLGDTIMDAAKRQPAEALLSRWGMTKEQFQRFVASQIPPEADSREQARILQAMQLQELQSFQQRVAECNGETTEDSEVRPEKEIGVEVHFGIVCKDGSSQRRTVKLIRFEGCFYLGAID